MLDFLVQVLNFTITVFVSYLLMRAYQRSKVYQVFILFIGTLILSLGFLADLLARLSGSIEFAYYLFKFYFVMGGLSFFFIMAYTELSRRPSFSYEFLFYSIVLGVLLTLRTLTNFDIYFEGGLISRGPPHLYLGGVNLVLIVFLIVTIWTLSRILLLSLKQYKRTTRTRTRLVLELEIILFISALIVLGIDFVIYLFNLLPDYTAPIFVNSPIFLGLLAFTIATYKIPYLPYLTTQEVLGTILFNREGLIIAKKIISRDLDEISPLLGGFFSAISSALEEALKIGELRRVEIGNMDLILAWSERAMLALFVRNPLKVHYDIANAIVNDISSLEIPPVVDSEFEERVLSIINRHLEPLFP